MNRIKSFTLGLLAGGIIAGIGTCLSVPYSGRKTRSYLKDKNQSARNTILNLKEHTDNIKHTVKKTVPASNAIVKNVIHDIKNSANEWKENAKLHQHALQVHLHEVQESLTELEQQVQHIKD